MCKQKFASSWTAHFWTFNIFTSCSKYWTRHIFGQKCVNQKPTAVPSSLLQASSYAYWCCILSSKNEQETFHLWIHPLHLIPRQDVDSLIVKATHASLLMPSFTSISIIWCSLFYVIISLLSNYSTFARFNNTMSHHTYLQKAVYRHWIACDAADAPSTKGSIRPPTLLLLFWL